MIGREHNWARRKWRGREEKMESAVPRWQEGSPLTFCQPEGGGKGGGETHRKREGERKGPEGYRGWVVPALDPVKERKPEIWGKVNLSLTPWPTANVLSSTRSQSDREGEEARQRAQHCPASSCQKRRKEWTQTKGGASRSRNTRPLDLITPSVVKTEKVHKVDFIKDTIIQLLNFFYLTITQSDLYRRRTNVSFSSLHSFTPTIISLFPPALTYSHTHALGHPRSTPLPHETTTQWHRPRPSLIGLSADENKATAPFDWIMPGNPWENPSHPLCS